MNEHKTELLKRFSIVLKERSKSEPQYQTISPEMLKFFSRKELIEIITHNFGGNVPEEHNLVEMENNELLLLIGDDFNIISYVMSNWSKETSGLPTKQEWINSKISSEPENKIGEKSTPENLKIDALESPIAKMEEEKLDVKEVKTEEKPSSKKFEKVKS